MTQHRRHKAREPRHSAPLGEFADQRDLPGTSEQPTLPEPDCKRFGEIANCLKHMHVLPESIGNALGRAERAPVLFAGPNGTGKTMAAAVLAHELVRDLYRVDLPWVVREYIGETEKNLDRIVDAAGGERRDPALRRGRRPFRQSQR